MEKSWQLVKTIRPQAQITDSSSTNAVSSSSARTTKRFPSPRCASAIRIGPPGLRRLSASAILTVSGEGGVSELLAALRGTIQMWQSEHDGSASHSVPVIEQPDRINCLLYNLARGHALLCDRTQLARADLAPVLEVTFDSAPTIRSKVFRALLENDGALKTSEVEKLLRCSKPTALKEMEALTVLGVADKTEGDVEYGRPEHELRLADKFHWFATDQCQGLRWP